MPAEIGGAALAFAAPSGLTTGSATDRPAHSIAATDPESQIGRHPITDDFRRGASRAQAFHDSAAVLSRWRDQDARPIGELVWPQFREVCAQLGVTLRGAA